MLEGGGVISFYTTMFLNLFLLECTEIEQLIFVIKITQVLVV